jgi:hypothetical protein
VLARDPAARVASLITTADSREPSENAPSTPSSIVCPSGVGGNLKRTHPAAEI